ncbi:MAG: sigma-70 family RNA polymerase sigma factor [Phycisphaerae bacterium]|nr:sigma-70 family RNA polymerase sigma factor [Phycisphaerae bacterium]
MDKRTAELDRLYREVGPQVWDYLRRRVSDATVAEEALQDTFLAVAKDFDALMAARSKRAWLIGIARNLLREHVRRAARRRAVSLPEEYPVADPPAEDFRVEAMRRAIDRLPDAQREVIELRLGHGLTYAEIAEAMAIPIGTVRSRLHNAVATLRAWAADVGVQRTVET